MSTGELNIHVTVSKSFRALDSERKRSVMRAISDACMSRAAELRVDLFEVGLRVRVNKLNLSVDKAPFRNSLLNVESVTLVAWPEEGFENQAQELLQTLKQAGCDGGAWK